MGWLDVACPCFKSQPTDATDESVDDVRHSLDALSAEEIETHFKQVQNIFTTAVRVMQNYIGKPAYPFMTYPKQLYPYILDLCDGLHPEQIENLKDICAKKKLRGINLQVTVKEAKLIHSKAKDLTHVYCKLWVGDDKHYHLTRELNRTSHLWWDEKFTLNVKNYDSDTFNLQVWSTRSLFGSWHTDASKVEETEEKKSPPKNSRGNYFIGDIIQTIRDMPSVGQEVFWSLKKGPRRIHTRGQIQLFLELGTNEDAAHYKHVHIHIALLRKCYEKQLSMIEVNKVWKNWLEILPNPALTLIHQHAIQNGLTATEQSLCSWLVTSALRMRNESRISFFIMWIVLQDLSGHVSETVLDPNLQMALRNNVTNFCTYSKEMISDLHKNFDVTKEEAADELYYLLKCMSDAELSKLSNFMSSYTPIENESTTWYLSVLSNHKEVFQDETNFEGIIEALCDVVRIYMKNQIILDDIFKRAWSVSYTKITCKNLDVVIGDAVKAIILHLVSVIGDNTRERKSSESLKMLQLYHNMRDLVNYIEDVLAGYSIHLGMNNFSEWFGDEMIIEWFLLCNIYTRPFIVRAVQLDTMEPANKDIKFGTSVPDVISIINEMVVEVWMKLKWKDQFNTHTSLIEAIKSCILEYTNAITSRTEASKFFCDGQNFHVTRKLCVCMSSVFALCQHLHVIREKVKSTLEAAESEYALAIMNPMESVEIALQLAIIQFYGCVLSKVEEQVKGYVKAMCASKIDMFKISIISELTNYVETTLEMLFNNLNTDAFYVILRQLWIIVVTCLEKALKHKKSWFSFLKSSSQTHRTVFAALNQMQNIFYCDGEGLTYHEMTNVKFLDLRHEIEKKVNVSPIMS